MSAELTANRHMVRLLLRNDMGKTVQWMLDHFKTVNGDPNSVDHVAFHRQPPWDNQATDTAFKQLHVLSGLRAEVLLAHGKVETATASFTPPIASVLRPSDNESVSCTKRDPFYDLLAIRTKNSSQKQVTINSLAAESHEEGHLSHGQTTTPQEIQRTFRFPFLYLDVNRVGAWSWRTTTTAEPRLLRDLVRILLERARVHGLRLKMDVELAHG